MPGSSSRRSLYETALAALFSAATEVGAVIASAPEDQVRAVIRGCEQLGITSFAVLHPQDRFGTAIPIHAVDGDHFATTISAAVSEGMVSWLMQYGGRVQVLEPQSLIDSVRARAETVLSAYAKE